LALRERIARNRIVISPMGTSSAEDDGLARPWHFAHLSKFALGGAGIVFTESTAVDPRGRITHADLGIWSERHADALRPIAEFIRSQGALAGIQIAHAGRRGASQKPWDGKEPLTEADAQRGEPPWPIWGPSALPAREGCQIPIAMSIDYDRGGAERIARCKLADRAGPDVLGPMALRLSDTRSCRPLPTIATCSTAATFNDACVSHSKSQGCALNTAHKALFGVSVIRHEEG
jgi:2,4-dienoyl-CoA reductase-like NADH-dependent reductase (Old Yellow Enzyme family)